LFVARLAQREGIEKIYTIVERDEVSTWMKLGFAREATIAGFYKRSDAFILGCTIDASPLESQLRIPVVSDFDEDDARADGVVGEGSAASTRAELTVAHAKKTARNLLDSPKRPLPVTKIVALRENDTIVRRATDKALRSGRALTAFETFGRDGERRYFHLTNRSGFDLVTSTESQSCFGNAFVELLTGPQTDGERQATISALAALCTMLMEQGVGSAFAMSPSDDEALATTFAYNGFRCTGLLHNHVTVNDVRKDAIVWSRKLTSATDD
jgi:hypothetical protein